MPARTEPPSQGPGPEPASGADYGYFLGLPAWAFPGWKNRYFADEPNRLANYARVFNAVEGNTTFYRVPEAGTVRRWRAAVAGSRFRFCFKLPREVTHESRPDLAQCSRFLDAIEPLSGHLGPLLVQFPATVGPAELDRFAPVFDAVAARHRFVIEVRHPAFFDDPGLLEPALEKFEAGRVSLDARPLYEGDRKHPEVLEALHEKPDLPVLAQTYGGVAFVRLILHPDLASNRRYIEQWAARVAGYLCDGIEPYMMIHCPNNLHCPELALDFHRTLQRQPAPDPLPDLAPWPIPEQLPLM